MKKIIIVVLAFTMVLGMLAACTTSQPSTAPSTQPSVAPSVAASTPVQSTAPTEAPKKTYKVASIDWTNAHGWRSTYDAQIKEVADQYIKDGIISQYQALCPNQDPALEVQYFNQCINDGYDIILINAGGSSGLDACFEAAKAKGIIAVPVDNIYPYPGVVGVQTDQTVWAGVNFDAMKKHFNGADANVVLMTGMPGTTGSSLRYDIWEADLKANPNFKVVAQADHSWSDVTSKQKMSEIIADGKKYDAILTEEACVGILQAIQEAKAPYPQFMTSDETVGYIRKLAEINATKTVIDFQVIENPPGIGASALKLAIRMAQGKQFNDGVLKTDKNGTNVAYYTPSYQVTPATLTKALDQWKNAADTDQMSTYLTDEAADAFFK
jgi:ribose transport system substrate-binding protein